MKLTSRRSNVMARNGMVATSQPLAAMAGLRILMDGGNAVDAAVATAATLAVVEPHSTGIGGDVFALVRMASDGEVRALNASGRSPAAASPQQLLREGLTSVPELSPFAVTVPGAVSAGSFKGQLEFEQDALRVDQLDEGAGAGGEGLLGDAQGLLGLGEEGIAVERELALAVAQAEKRHLQLGD